MHIHSDNLKVTSHIFCFSFSGVWTSAQCRNRHLSESYNISLMIACTVYLLIMKYTKLHFSPCDVFQFTCRWNEGTIIKKLNISKTHHLDAFHKRNQEVKENKYIKRKTNNRDVLFWVIVHTPHPPNLFHLSDADEKTAGDQISLDFGDPQPWQQILAWYHPC